MNSARIAAIDLGATSGRVMVADVDNNSLHLRTVSRFSNTPQLLADGLHWDITQLMDAVFTGLMRAGEIDSVGVDSWAVDYALLREGELLDEPFHYRDDRTATGIEAMHSRMPFPALFARNGLQFLPLTTVYQLAAEDPDHLARADRIRLIPDLLTWSMTGADTTERTNASTTGLLGLDGRWDTTVMELTGLTVAHWGELIDPGTPLGVPTAAFLSRYPIFGSPQVMAVASHDTASAVVGTPIADASDAFISCGTWALVGMEIDSPITSQAALEQGFTNERGVDDRIRFLRNEMGLWILNEYLQELSLTSQRSELLAMAATLPAPSVLIDVRDPVFASTGSIVSRIDRWLADRDMPGPRDPVPMVRLLVESLAHAHAAAVRAVGDVTGASPRRICITGGGSLNALLCQRIADVAGMPVIAGPAEATSLGNVMVQARAMGVVTGSLEALRQYLGHNSELTTYMPARAGATV